MNVYSTFAVTDDEPVPTLSLYGHAAVLVFPGAGARDEVAVHLTRIEDLPTWLREFATRLTEFAELVEVRAMGAAS